MWVNVDKDDLNNRTTNHRDIIRFVRANFQLSPFYRQTRK